MYLQQHPCLTASSASMPLVHKHRNQRFLFTVSQKCLHIQVVYWHPATTTFVHPCTARAAGYRLHGVMVSHKTTTYKIRQVT